MTTDGENFYVTGYTTPESVTNWDIFIAKFDADLNMLWYKYWGGSGTESARGISVHEDQVYVAGLTESEEYSSGATDALLLVYDTSGNFVSHHTWGDSLDNSFRDVAIHDDAIYLSGSSGIGLANEGSISGNLLKVSLDQVTNLIEEEDHGLGKVLVFPNPSNGVITIDQKQNYPRESTLSFYNLLGELVFVKSFDMNKVSFDLQLPSGVFIYQLTDQEKLLATGKLVISK
jgi:hypothetical protein